MPNRKSMGPFLGVSLALVAIYLAGTPGLSQDKNPNAGAEQNRKPLYVGSSACEQCHSRDNDVKDRLCRLTEFKLWKLNDKHQDAAKVLSDDRSKRMGELLGIVVTESKACLSCHGIPKEKAKAIDTSYDEKKDGVTCSHCHGAYENWINNHGTVIGSSLKEWREKSRQVKESQFGMTDLWDAGARTKTCSSCHIGDTKEGRVVTHDMYAAGHPPLSGFETATFCLGQPPHWQLVREKPKNIQELLRFNPDAGELEQTKLVILGNVAAFRETMNLLASQAKECLEAMDPAKQVLDIALFDCAQCHHELRRPSWRQTRGYKTTPGRPQFRPFSTAILEVAIRHSGGKEAEINALKNGIANLYKAFDAKPFGELKMVQSSASDLVVWSNNLLIKLDSQETKFNKAGALRLLKDIARTPEESVPDYDTARQMAWSFEVIYDEASKIYQNSMDANDAAIKEKLAKNHAEMVKQLGLLETGLQLKLPYTDKAKTVKDYPSEDKRNEFLNQLGLERQAIYDKYWPSTLQRQGDYGPDEFKKTFAAIAKLLE